MAVQSNGQATTVTVSASGVLAVTGELDLAGAAILRRRLDATVIAIDLHAVTFIDAAGLRVLEESAGVSLVAPSEPVRRLLALVGEAGRLTIKS